MHINKDYLDGLLAVRDLTLADIPKVLEQPVHTTTYDFKMGLAIATYDTKEVMYNEETKEAVRLFDLDLPDYMKVDTMSLMYPVHREVLSFCNPSIDSLMASPETLVTFNQPYLLDGTLTLIFVVYLKSKEIGTFMSHLNTKHMVFRKNFSNNDFTEMTKDSKLFIESLL